MTPTYPILKFCQNRTMISQYLATRHRLPKDSDLKWCECSLSHESVGTNHHAWYATYRWPASHDLVNGSIVVRNRWIRAGWQLSPFIHWDTRNHRLFITISDQICRATQDEVWNRDQFERLISNEMTMAQDARQVRNNFHCVKLCGHAEEHFIQEIFRGNWWNQGRSTIGKCQSFSSFYERI
jgi:hypothetical protein